MSAREIITVVEIDIDTCTRTFGTSPCLAALGADTPHKCFNTFHTCSFKSAYERSTKTLKFIGNGYNVVGGVFIPALESVGGYEQEINIAGYTPDIGGLGQRASVSVKFADFATRDVETDKYFAERISGAAQFSDIGYDPLTQGSFWQKFRARNPNFAGRDLRVIQGHYDDTGAIVYDKVRAYVMSDFEGPDTSGKYTIKAKDILSLADNKNAQAPKTNRGRLNADITASATTAVLTPVGIGVAEYPLEGLAVIGSELVSFTRAGNTLTIARGRKGTDAAAHSAGDSVQVCYNVVNQRADVVIRDLLENYAGVDPSYIPTSEWGAEFDRWGSKLILNATICKPTGVTTLLSEINQLGITLWWDELQQKIRLRLNHPSETTPQTFSDAGNNMSITRVDNDDERATRIAFWSVQIDPTKDLNKENFLRGYYAIFVDGESPNSYGKETTQTIYTRWLNQGNDAAIKIIAGRLLNRYKTAPVTYEVVVDAKDDISLADVVYLESYANTDVTGLPVPSLTQVYYRSDERSGSTVKLKLQAFQFAANYGVITENTRPVYGSSTQAQKDKGTYIVGPSLVFSDGRAAYQLV